MKKKHDILWRVNLSFFIICLMGFAIIIQIFRIQFVEGDAWRARADSLTLKYVNKEATRGNIFSDDGSMLATSLPVYTLHLDLRAEGMTNELFDSNLDSLCTGLSVIFPDKSRQDFMRELRKARIDGERYHLLRRGVRFADLQKIKKLPLFRKGPNKGGLIIDQESRRELSFDQLASRTLGTARDVKPVGIEAAFNKDLQGVSGQQLMKKISGGVWMPVRDNFEIEPKDGNDIVTTLDINIQDVAENSLETHLREHNADHGCAVLMEVSTGEVKAIANLTRDSNGNYVEDFNYAIGEATEPGSTFKTATLLAAFDDGLLEPTDSVNVSFSRTYYGQVMKDAHAPSCSRMTVQRAFEVSSNVGISAAITQAYLKDKNRFVEKLRSFGLNNKLGLQIEGEGKPRIKSPSDQDWAMVSLPWMSIGYEVKITPLQLLTFYNAIANNGREVRPRFVKEIRNHGKVIRSFPVEVIRDSIASADAIRKIRGLLEGVVQHGTASHLRNSPYSIAGKTGTAQMYKDKLGYDKDNKRYQASFVGYFPADKPKYSCVVVVYGPSNDMYYGGAVAAPIFKEVADKVFATHLDMHSEPLQRDTTVNVFPLAKAGLQKDLKRVVTELGIPVDSRNAEASWISPGISSDGLVLNERNVNGSTIPNVTGMGARDAVFLLENKGLSVRMSGKGVVKNQFPAAGSAYRKGQIIYIELE